MRSFTWSYDMHLLQKWRGLVLALVAAFVPLTAAAATSLEVEGPGAVPGFHTSEQLRRYLALQMAEAQPADWRFAPAAAGDAAAPDRVKWRFQLNPYAEGEVRTFVPPYMDDKTFGVHRPITIEARLYLNGKYQTLVKKKAIIEGGPDDPDLAAAVASLTQKLLGSSGAYLAINSGQHQGRPFRRMAISRRRAGFAVWRTNIIRAGMCGAPG
jgi:hypothetical protein